MLIFMSVTQKLFRRNFQSNAALDRSQIKVRLFQSTLKNIYHV